MFEKEQIVYKNISELKLNEKNPRKNDTAVGTVAKSIEKYGFRNPLIVDENNVVWCGNTRLKASKKLGLTEAPCIIVKDLTEQQMTELALLDNKTNEIAEWDIDMLGDIIPDLDLSDFGEIDWGVPELNTEQDGSYLDEPDPFEDIEKLDKHYGVPYQGNKSRIADIIISILPAGERLVDLFGGGGVHNSLCYVKWQME